MSEFQERCLEALRYFRLPKHKYYIMPTLGNVAKKIGSNRLAVYSAMRSLQKQGKVAAWRHREDQWGLLCWTEVRAGESLAVE